MTDSEMLKAQAAEIERLRFDLKRAVQFTKGVIRHAGNSGDDYLAEQARTALAELTGAQKDGN